MEQRVSVVTLGVDDLARMRDFYIQKLGWKPVAENKDIIFFKMNGFLFSLFGRKGLATGAGVSEIGSGFRSFTIAYNVNSKQEVDSLCKELKEKDVKILKEPETTSFGGYFFYLADPEENVLEVAYNPYVLLDDNGNAISHDSIDHL